MTYLAAFMGLLLIVVILRDAFETIILPRRVSGGWSLTRLIYGVTWAFAAASARRMRTDGRRENFLSFFGPLSLIMLIVLWATALVFGFALLQWGAGSQLTTPQAEASLWNDLYLSGTTFFTLGLGDVAPLSPVARLITVVEAGMGFGFLALIIGYLPALNQAFSRREVSVTLLDARAGSPPAAVEFLMRRGAGDDPSTLNESLAEWEKWCAELLESLLSYPVLSFFRSQHENQSWLAALTCILDVCALVIAAGEEACVRQARLTFAIGRHAAVDLSQIFAAAPRTESTVRLAKEDLQRLRQALADTHVNLARRPDAELQLAGLRAMYEPYVLALSERLLMELPLWLPPDGTHDAWETTAWERLDKTHLM